MEQAFDNDTSIETDGFSPQHDDESHRNLFLNDFGLCPSGWRSRFIGELFEFRSFEAVLSKGFSLVRTREGFDFLEDELKNWSGPQSMTSLYR